MEEKDDKIKKIGPSDPNLIVKSNTLMEGKFKFKLWEMRLFEMMISLIGREDTEFNRQAIRRLLLWGDSRYFRKN